MVGQELAIVTCLLIMTGVLSQWLSKIIEQSKMDQLRHGGEVSHFNILGSIQANKAT